MEQINLKELYKSKVDEISNFKLNQDQKILFKRILDKTEESEVKEIYNFLIRTVKTGFVFDEAPTANHQTISILKYDEKRSFQNQINGLKNQLIIGENYDALKNLIVIERERERERVINF